FFVSSRRRHTRFSRDWSSDVCSSDLGSNGEANEIAKYAERWVRTLEQLSTISLAVDAVWSNKGGQYIPPTHTFGYFAIYRGTEEIGRASCRERGWNAVAVG